MQIQQLQVSAEPLEDRLLLRIASTTQEEVRVFFTRRFLRELWPGLMGMLFGHLAAPAVETSATASSFGDSPSFDQPYQNDDPVFPLGMNPLLLAEISLTPAGPGLCAVTLREHKQRSINIHLTTELFQALCSMLRAASEQAGWDLALEYTAPHTSTKPDTRPAASLPPKNLLH